MGNPSISSIRSWTSVHITAALTERINRTLKYMIAAFLKNNHKQWDQWLPEFRFAINTAWHESTGFTPVEIALGWKLKGPLERMISRRLSPDHPAYATVERQEALFQVVRENVARAQERQGRYYNCRRKAVSYKVGDHVWVRAFPQSRAEDSYMAKLAPKWKGPAQIKKVLSQVNYLVELTEKAGPFTVHVANLKPFFGVVTPFSEGEGV